MGKAFLVTEDFLPSRYPTTKIRIARQIIIPLIRNMRPEIVTHSAAFDVPEIEIAAEGNFQINQAIIGSHPEYAFRVWNSVSVKPQLD